MIVSILWLCSALAADPCAKTPLQVVSAPSQGITGLRVSGLNASVVVTTADGADLTVRGEQCVGDGGVRLVRRGTVLELEARRPKTAPLVITLSVPASIPALTIHEHRGDLVVRDVPARVAVVSSAGSVTVDGVGALRVASLDGDVTVGRVTGDVQLDGVTGKITRETPEAPPRS